MPAYTYKCSNCGNLLDVHISFSDTPPNICPHCKHEALYRVYKPVGVVFKGSGFYSTDNKSSSGRLNGSKASTSESESKKSKTINKSTKNSESKTTEKSQSPTE